MNATNGFHQCPMMVNDFLSVNEDIQSIQGALGSWIKSRTSRSRKRDKLAYELEELQDKVEESLIARENKHSLQNPDGWSLEEKIFFFLDWRNQMQVLHSSIGRSLVIARRMRNGYDREEIRDLQDIQYDIEDYLYETDYLQEKARQKLEDIKKAREPQSIQATSRNGRDSSYQSPCNQGNKCLADIVEEAEKIKAESAETSLRMENEVERLKAKSISMAKDLVALNEVIERQKRELVDLTRMKRSNEMTEKDLDISDRVDW